MDVAGLVLGAVPIAAKVSSQCYKLFGDLSSVALDNNDFRWDLSTEKVRFEKWIQLWGLDDEAARPKFNGKENYVFQTLAAMIALLADVDALHSKYGIQVAPEHTQASKPPGVEQKVKEGWVRAYCCCSC